MNQYEIELKKLNGKFDEDDLRIGKKLADGCYDKHYGYEFSIETLKPSDNNKDAIFEMFNKNKVDFWDRIYKLNEDELKIYFNALHEFCIYMGMD